MAIAVLGRLAPCDLTKARVYKFANVVKTFFGRCCRANGVADYREIIREDADIVKQVFAEIEHRAIRIP